MTPKYKAKKPLKKTVKKPVNAKPASPLRKSKLVTFVDECGEVIREAKASDPKTSRASLAVFARDVSPQVRLAAKKNPNTPKEGINTPASVLKRLASEPSEAVRRGIVFPKVFSYKSSGGALISGTSVAGRLALASALRPEKVAGSRAHLVKGCRWKGELAKACEDSISKLVEGTFGVVDLDFMRALLTEFAKESHGAYCCGGAACKPEKKDGKKSDKKKKKGKKASRK